MNTSTHGRLKHPLLPYSVARIVRALCLWAVLLGLPASLRAAQVTTDQQDYAPGTTAVITGLGFAPGEEVVLQVLHGDGTPDEGDDHQPWTVTADAQGAFTTSWHVCEDDCVGATLVVTAAGQSSGLQAQATFTDAPFFGVRLISVVSLSGGCTSTVITPTNVQTFVRPGSVYRFTFSLNTNGTPPPCFLTTNASGPPFIVFSLGTNFGNATLVAGRVGAGTTYTNNFFIPPAACSSTPISFICNSGLPQQVLGNTPLPDRLVQLTASLDCFNTLSCSATPPTLFCPSNITANTLFGACFGVVLYSLPPATGSPSPIVNCFPPPGSLFNKGVTPVICTASNSAGGTFCIFTITVQDQQPPVLACPGALTRPTEPGTCAAAVSFTVTATDNCPGVAVSCFPPSGSQFPKGTTIVACSATDSSGNTASGSNGCSFAVVVLDAEAPSVSCAPGVIVPAGAGCQAIVPDLLGLVTASDNCATPAEMITIQSPAPGTLVGLGNTPVVITVLDGPGGNSGQCSLLLTVANSAPVIDNITAPTEPLALGTVAQLQVQFSDPDAGQTHTVVLDWGDGTSETIALNAGVLAVTQPHTYAEAGVYSIAVSVSDPCVIASQLHEFIVVYDPEGGFVTGGGWIASPPGAYPADPSLEGKANFGFVAKYHYGASVPTGQTEFQFKAGYFNFHSTEYEWLVVSGAKAQYKGSGAVNGVDGYSFRLTLTDGNISGGGGVDKFRIKISGPGGVIYDNRLGSPDDIKTANPQAIDGGSIVIHK